MPPVIQACQHNSQYAGHMQLLGDQVRGKWREQGKGELDGRIINRFCNPRGNPSNRQPDGNSTDADKEELPGNRDMKWKARRDKAAGAGRKGTPILDRAARAGVLELAPKPSRP